MWGIIPAAGKGSRIQPLAFSKELLPVGSSFDGETERPLAVSEYLVERMIRGGASKICFVVSPGKSDILEYYGSKVYSADVCYTVQSHAAGLCDAIFRALPFISARRAGSCRVTRHYLVPRKKDSAISTTILFPSYCFRSIGLSSSTRLSPMMLDVFQRSK